MTMKKKISLSLHLFRYYSLGITAVSVTLYLLFNACIWLLRKAPGGAFEKMIARCVDARRQLLQKLNQPFKYEVPTSTIIFLSEQNLKAGRARTAVTISAISVGIGIIVCLVSLGYGLESLVISRVAKLEQLKQVDIAPKPGSKLKLDDEILTQLQSNSHVSRVSPAVVLATKTTFQEATSDVPNMGVTNTFLEDAGWTLMAGTFFNDDETRVAMQDVSPASPTNQTEIDQLDSAANSNTDAGSTLDLTTATELIATQSAILTKAEELLLAESNSIEMGPGTRKISLSTNTTRKAIVNRSMVRTWGISEGEAIGRKIGVSYVLTGQLLSNPAERIETLPADYEIIGVVDDKKTPFMYVPLADVQSLGISHYSQLKTVMNDSNFMSTFRTDIENQGFATSSVADTVSQIRSLFSTIKFFLGSIGAVALGVAALGMFNTLTVSLLERTKEIGLVKALGMVSEEVERLFLVEALLISLKGGFYGIVLGLLFGKVISILISLTTITTQFQFIDVSYFPWPLVVGIVVLSFVVGLTTGIYPAKRATKITALNALRYE